MQAIHSRHITGTPEEFVEEIVGSNCFAGSHPFTYEDKEGNGLTVMLFALKCPVSLQNLIDMMHVLVESLDFYDAWRGGSRPSDAEIQAMSPME